MKIKECKNAFEFIISDCFSKVKKNNTTYENKTYFNFSHLHKLLSFSISILDNSLLQPSKSPEDFISLSIDSSLEED
ncbi:MAG: hypothetical protein MJ252_01460 [archaeon]|nr:hypothetical protein [archaeon]